MQEMKVRIRTKSSVILSALSHTSVMTATQEFFSGSVLRGIFAARYVTERRLGDMAHEDADFMRLFYGGLRFVDAYPLDLVTDLRAIPLPFSMQRSKDGQEMKDLLQRDAELAPGFKGMKGFAAISGKELYPIAVQKGISLHMSRSDLSDSSGRERLAGKSQSGGIYNYEAIAPGQVFEGTICGAGELLHHLHDCMGSEQFPACVGRSRFTQYGQCEIALMPIQDVPAAPVPAKERICIRLETPFLPRTGVPGDAASMLGEIVAALNEKTSGGFFLPQEPRSIFAKAAEIGNFVGIWGMRRPRGTALAAGTVFALEKTGGWQDSDAAAINALFHDGVGRRREEGFGQLRLWDGEKLCCAAEAGDAAPAARELGKETKRIARDILLAHIIEQVRVCAAMDADEAGATFPSNARHAFARLEHELGASPEGACERVRQVWENQGNEQTPLRRMMRRVRVHGRPLYEYFTDAARMEMPYIAAEKQNLAADTALADAAEELGIADGIASLLVRDDIFYAYWHTFVRFAGKGAGQREEGGAEI